MDSEQNWVRQLELLVILVMQSKEHLSELVNNLKDGQDHTQPVNVRILWNLNIEITGTSSVIFVPASVY